MNVVTSFSVRFPPGVHQTGLVLEAGLDLSLVSPTELLTLLTGVEQAPAAVALQPHLVWVKGLVGAEDRVL